MQPWPYSGVAWRVDWAYIIMNAGVAIKRHPFAKQGETIREVERSKPCTRIGSRLLLSQGHVLKTEEALEEGVKSDGRVTFAAPDRRALKSELKVFRWFEADFFHVYPGGVGIGMPFETSDKKHIPEGASHARKKRNLKEVRAINLKGVDILRIVAVGQAPALCGPEPMVALANGY